MSRGALHITHRDISLRIVTLSMSEDVNRITERRASPARKSLRLSFTLTRLLPPFSGMNGISPLTTEALRLTVAESALRDPAHGEEVSEACESHPAMSFLMVREDEHVSVTDDDDAITRCQRGDVEGLATLIRRYESEALRLAYLLTGDCYLAEDIVQDSFIQAFHAMPRFRLGSPFAPWFHRIVTNTTRMRLRSAVRRREVSLSELLQDDTPDARPLLNVERVGSNPVAHAEHMEDRAAIGQALAMLTQKQREAVALRYYFARSDEEIATILGCRVNTARHRVYDGLRALGHVIRRHFPWLLQEPPHYSMKGDTTSSSIEERATDAKFSR